MLKLDKSLQMQQHTKSHNKNDMDNEWIFKIEIPMVV